jgi:hypothetical protein
MTSINNLESLEINNLYIYKMSDLTLESLDARISALESKLNGTTGGRSRKNQKQQSEDQQGGKKSRKQGGKRKLSGYMKFVKMESKKLGDMPITERGRKMGEMWRAMSDSDKKKYM